MFAGRSDGCDVRSKGRDQMRLTFPALRFGLMVGLGGEVPARKMDIRPSDVVVSKPNGMSGGVIRYGFGKTAQKGRFVRTGR